MQTKLIARSPKQPYSTSSAIKTWINIVKNIRTVSSLSSFLKKNIIPELKTHKVSFSASKNNELEILCIPPWLIEKVDANIDHFHNAASFVEMPRKIVENYVKFIRKFKTKEISLISYDRFDLKTTFNPEELNIFFNNELDISWKNTLIKGYNRKLIYLTSK